MAVVFFSSFERHRMAVVAVRSMSISTFNIISEFLASMQIGYVLSLFYASIKVAFIEEKNCEYPFGCS